MTTNPEWQKEVEAQFGEQPFDRCSFGYWQWEARKEGYFAAKQRDAEQIAALKAANKDLQAWFDNLKSDYDALQKVLNIYKGALTPYDEVGTPEDQIRSLRVELADLKAEREAAKPVAWRHRIRSTVLNSEWGPWSVREFESVLPSSDTFQIEALYPAPPAQEAKHPFACVCAECCKLPEHEAAKPVACPLPDDAVVEMSFKTTGTSNEALPTITITLPPNHWKTRDRIFAMLTAAPPAQPVHSLLQPAVVVDARNSTPEQLRRGADIYASLKEPPTRAAPPAREEARPVCFVGSWWNGRRGFDVVDFKGKRPEPDTPLYTTPPAQNSDIQEQYNELIMAVGMKYHNETRHQTALRYIRRAEECKTGSASNVAIKQQKGEEKSIPHDACCRVNYTAHGKCNCGACGGKDTSGRAPKL